MPNGLQIGSLTQEFALRIVVPGSLIFFLLAVLWPANLAQFTLSPVAGAFGFLVAGTISYVLYRGFYQLISGSRTLAPYLAPQLADARRQVETATERHEGSATIRAFYIEWREVRAGADPRLNYVSRMAPYVQSGYQSGLIFLAFGIGASITGHGPDVVLGLLVLGVGLFLAAAAEDRVLNVIEHDMLASSPEAITNLVRQQRRPP